jgi:hypothetical protein
MTGVRLPASLSRPELISLQSNTFHYFFPGKKSSGAWSWHSLAANKNMWSIIFTPITPLCHDVWLQGQRCLLPLPFKGIIKFISKPYSPQKQTRVHERQIREMFQEGNWFWRNVLIHRQLASEVDRESRSFLACPSSGRTSILCATATVNTDRILSGMMEEGNHLSCVINFL